MAFAIENMTRGRSLCCWAWLHHCETLWADDKYPKMIIKSLFWKISLAINDRAGGDLWGKLFQWLKTRKKGGEMKSFQAPS